MKNAQIAEMFNTMADVLEFKGELVFKVNAYRKAARVIENLAEDIENIWRRNALLQIPGVGEGIAKKIDEFLRTGRMRKYEEIVKDVPPSLIELMGIPGLGPKTLASAHKSLSVKKLEDLKRVIEDGTLAALPGMGTKKVENIRKGIERFEKSKERIPLGVVLPVVERIINSLKGSAKIEKIEAAGSLRRKKESVGDVDILAAGGSSIINAFVMLPEVVQVLAAGETKGSVVVEGGMQIDLRVVAPSCFGAALQYFTGSKAHNIRLREMAKQRGWKISEYGVFEGEHRIGGREEEEVYRMLGLEWIPPELREDNGEIEASLEGRLPTLLEGAQIKGDLHVHSKCSDGTATLEQIAQRAKSMGYTYIAICDHSQSLRYAGGLREEELLRQIEEIKRLNEKMDGVRLLSGIEVEIKQDGSLDYSDSILAKLDIVIGAVHVGFRQNVTERMIRAMQNPHLDAIAHPTGRLITSREGYDVQIEKVIEWAAKTDTALEINAYYDRLDLPDIYCRKAKEEGVKFLIATDAHHLDQLWMMQLGVAVARRGWLTAEDVLNTWELDRLLEYLRHHKRG
jgi:DNA polymerase (family 10)